MSRKLLIWVFFASLMIYGIFIFFRYFLSEKASIPDECFVPVQVGVLFVEGRPDKVAISWTTQCPANENILYYGPMRHKNIQPLSTLQSVLVRGGGNFATSEHVTGSEAEGFSHYVELTGLLPSTAYFFVLKNNSWVSEQYFFLTP